MTRAASAPPDLVAYYRVSTVLQAETGWSLSAQRTTVHRYAEAKGLRVIAEYEEAESGFRVSARTPVSLDNRPELAKALDTCRRQRATLVIAALDRLARNVVFVATLVQTRVNFVALDLPEGTTPFIIHIYAAMAEEESRARGRARTAALALLKAQGVETWPARMSRAAQERAEAMRPVFLAIRCETGVLGAYPLTRELIRRDVASPDGRPWLCGRVARMLTRLGLYEPERDKSNRREAAERERDVLPRLAAGRAAGRTVRQIATELNEAGFRTGKGALWTMNRLRSFIQSRKRRARKVGAVAALDLASTAANK
jgi:DNA invertase Pin-like site-specific DNA recombinase